MIVAILGKAGSGKTAVAKEVSKALEYPLLETSNYLKKIGQLADSHQQREQLHDVKYGFQDKDPDWLWKHIEVDLDTLKDKCVISGIREPYLLYKVISRYESVFVVGLEVSLFNRYARICQRDGYISTEKFVFHDHGDVDLGIDIALAGCDVLVDANGPLTQVVGTVIQLLPKEWMNVDSASSEQQ